MQSLWEGSRELPWKPSRNNPLQWELTEAPGIRILISFRMLLLPHICSSESVCACACARVLVFAVCVCAWPLLLHNQPASLLHGPSTHAISSAWNTLPLPHPHLGLYSLRVGGGLFSPEKPSLTPHVWPGASLVLPRPPTAGFLLPNPGSHGTLVLMAPRASSPALGLVHLYIPGSRQEPGPVGGTEKCLSNE